MTLPRRNGRFYVNTRGLSMWPVLIPGDILSAVAIRADEAAEGDLLVLDRESEFPMVHRLVRLSSTPEGSVGLETSGDRSGPDPPRSMKAGEELLRVTGVLRKRKWRRIPGKPPGFICRLPMLLIRIHCRLIRELQW